MRIDDEKARRLGNDLRERLSICPPTLDGMDKPPVALVYFPMVPIPDAILWGVPTQMMLVVRTRAGYTAK